MPVVGADGGATLARLLAAQLPAMAGAMDASGKMRVGYFTQYQVEELDGADTPLEHMTRQMKGATPGAVRAQLGAEVAGEGEPLMGSEDFSAFADRVPAFQLRIGSGAPGRRDALHNAGYRPDERCIGLGVQALSRVALDILS